MADVFMQAPKGTTGANIEGHEYDIPSNGKIKVVSPNHVETLKRHGFVETDADGEPDFDSMDKDQLVTYIEERGGDADDSMSLKKLRRLAREAFEEAQGEEA